MTATRPAGSVAWDERRTAVYLAIAARREPVVARWQRRFDGVPAHVVEDAFDAIVVAAVATEDAFRKDPADERALNAFIATAMHNELVNYIAGPASRRTADGDVRLAGTASTEDVADLVVQRDEAKVALELAANADPRTVEYMLAEADGVKRAELREAGLSDRQIRNRRSEAAGLRLSLRRKLGALWPIPAVQRAISGLTGSDATATAGQLVAGGAGRGAGGVLAANLVACLVGAGTIGGACIATGIVDLSTDRDDRPGPARVRAPAPPDPTPEPRTARMRTAPEPTATPRATKKRASSNAARSSKTQGESSPSSHEQTPASSAPAGSLPGGQSEFGASSATSSPPPAPVPAAPGANEFGP